MPTPFSATRESFGLGSPAIKALDASYQGRQSDNGDSGSAEKRRRGTANESARSEHELDQEATAALLMLNHDRRSWRGGKSSGGGGGMSVKDLLSG